MSGAGESASGTAVSTDARSPRSPSRGFAAGRLLAWSVRRELWQHRAVFVVPALISAFFIGAALLAALTGPDLIRQLHEADPGRRAQFLAMPLAISGEVLRFIGFVIAAAYSIGAFYTERRDRSLLFWKSLPVPDWIAAVGKAAIPLAVVPAITMVAITVTYAAMLLIESIAFLVAGFSPATLLSESAVISILPGMAAAIVFQTLWQAPLYGFLLLISSWASRVPVLFVLLAPPAAAIIESFVFGTSWVFDTVKARFTDGFANVMSRDAHAQLADPGAVGNAIAYLAAPAVWAGLLVAAGFIALTVWMRRRAEPI
jgi:ABC-2 type transport system permease protein